MAAEGATAAAGVGGIGAEAAPLCPAMEFEGMFWGLCRGGAMVGREGCWPVAALCVPVESRDKQLGYHKSLHFHIHALSTPISKFYLDKAEVP